MDRRTLIETLRFEKELYLKDSSFFHRIRLSFSNEMTYEIWKYVRLLRICEYYKSNCDTLLHKILLTLFRRKKNRLGLKLSIEIHENCFEEGLLIYHGGIVINSLSKIGKNCRLHGNNCIGNDGKTNKCPTLGDNIEIGFGAGIFGDILIDNDTVIGANAVVIKSCNREAVLVGVPAVEKTKH